LWRFIILLLSMGVLTTGVLTTGVLTTGNVAGEARRRSSCGDDAPGRAAAAASR
jgi:hypothetical protein